MRTKRAFKIKSRTFFIIFKGFQWSKYQKVFWKVRARPLIFTFQEKFFPLFRINRGNTINMLQTLWTIKQVLSYFTISTISLIVRLSSTKQEKIYIIRSTLCHPGNPNSFNSFLYCIFTRTIHFLEVLFQNDFRKCRSLLGFA